MTRYCEHPVYRGEGEYEQCGIPDPPYTVTTMPHAYRSLPFRVCVKHAEMAWADGCDVDGYEPPR